MSAVAFYILLKPGEMCKNAKNPVGILFFTELCHAEAIILAWFWNTAFETKVSIIFFKNIDGNKRII